MPLSIMRPRIARLDPSREGGTRFVFPEPATGAKRILQTTRHETDTGGRFRFTTTPEQMAGPELAVVLHAEHPDYPPEDRFEHGFRRVRPDDGQGGRTSIDIELSPGRPITGVVVAPEGRPAAGVAVQASSFFAPRLPLAAWSSRPSPRPRPTVRVASGSWW